MKEHIDNGPRNYYLLIHDRNYLSFASRYHKNVKQNFYFPPGGVAPDHAAKVAPLYDLTFIASYHNYRERLALIRSYDRFLTARFLRFMCQDPDEPAEQVLQKTIEYYNISLNDEEFPNLFYEMRQVCFCTMTCYREKIIRIFLNAGIQVHIYSDIWKNAPFASCPNLICHPAVNPQDSLEVMARSRISLSIMPWHKDRLTERILNAMLCHSAVSSDRSGILEDIFINEQDRILFSLKRLDALLVLVKELLSDKERLQKITITGYEKAPKYHRWKTGPMPF